MRFVGWVNEMFDFSKGKFSKEKLRKKKEKKWPRKERKGKRKNEGKSEALCLFKSFLMQEKEPLKKKMKQEKEKQEESFFMEPDSK